MTFRVLRIAFNKAVGSATYSSWGGDIQSAFTSDVRASIKNIAADKRAVTTLRQALQSLGWRFGSKDEFMAQLKEAGFQIATHPRPIAGDINHVSCKDL
jgi:uncharacterized protein YukE